jgi:hypothetical protein
MKKLAFLFSLFVFSGMLLSAQASKTLTIDAAIKDANSIFNGSIPTKAKTSFVSLQSPAPALSAYVADQLTSALSVNLGRSLVARRNVVAAEREMKLDVTQELTDAQAISVGKKLGAEVVVAGWVTENGKDYALELTAINIADTKVLRTVSYKLVSDARLKDLLKDAPPVAAAPPAVVPAQTPVAQATPVQAVPVAAGATGTITVTNNDSDATITMVKIYKGFEARESELLFTHAEPIRQSREMSWHLPEDDYYVKVFWNANTERGNGDHIAILEGNFYSAKASRGGLTFRRQ